MAKPPVLIPRDLADLPHRLTTRHVLALAGYGRGTLTARIAAGTMPGHEDRGRDGLIFNRDAVLRALGLGVPEQRASEPETNPWDMTPEKWARFDEFLAAPRTKQHSR